MLTDCPSFSSLLPVEPPVPLTQRKPNLSRTLGTIGYPTLYIIPNTTPFVPSLEFQSVFPISCLQKASLLPITPCWFIPASLYHRRYEEAMINASYLFRRTSRETISGGNELTPRKRVMDSTPLFLMCISSNSSNNAFSRTCRFEGNQFTDRLRWFHLFICKTQTLSPLFYVQYNIHSRSGSHKRAEQHQG